MPRSVLLTLRTALVSALTNFLKSKGVIMTTQAIATTPALINVFEGVIGTVRQLVVNARDLHTFLQVGKHFASWIQERIGKYEFVENEDFTCLSQNRETQRKDGQQGIVRTTEYHLALDMAKELSMVENNEKGREARRYFIAMEKKALGMAAPLPKADKLTVQQEIAIKRLVREIESCFHYTGAASGAVWNALRVRFNLQTFADLQSSQYAQVITMLEPIHSQAERYQDWKHAAELTVIDQVIGQGLPWTPYLKKELARKLKESLPNCPNWLEIAERLGIEGRRVVQMSLDDQMQA